MDRNSTLNFEYKIKEIHLSFNGGWFKAKILCDVNSSFYSTAGKHNQTFVFVLQLCVFNNKLDVKQLGLVIISL